jgi:hypothetical protein
MMVHSESVKEHDFQGMYTVMLYHKGKPVSVATMRVFGTFLAEMPLVATRECARREGHCRALMAAIETFLKGLKVRAVHRIHVLYVLLPSKTLLKGLIKVGALCKTYV